MSKLLDTIKNALENLVTLEIVTAVGQIKFQASEQPSNPSERLPDIDFSKDPKVMLTKINLLQGDIRTVLDPAFVTGDYQSLRDFHLAREKEGHDIIQKNLAALKELYNTVKEWEV